MPSADLIPTHCHEASLQTLNASEAESLVREGSLELSEAGRKYMRQHGYGSLVGATEVTASRAAIARSTHNGSNGASHATASQPSTAKPAKKQ